MRGLKIFLLISFISGILYILSLLIIPEQLANLGWGPEEKLWTIFLVPLYAGLGTANWYAFRNPEDNKAIVKAFIVMWGFTIFVTHIYRHNRA
jgi:hypothetical protein